MVLRVDERLGRLDRTREDGGQVEPLLTQLDPVPHDPAHVEEVIN